MIKEFMVFGRKYYIDDSGKITNSYGKKLHIKNFGREYPYIEFRHKKDGIIKRKRLFIHRLIAELFIPNPSNLAQVNHKDGNKLNYCIDNLEWVTPSENQTHSRYILKNENGFKDRPVICMETEKKYKSIMEAERDSGALCSHICECASGKRKTTGGKHWRYL